MKSVRRPHADSICVASVWQMESPESANLALSQPSRDFVYRRDGHPNDCSLADALAEGHGAVAALLTAQGMSAIGAVALTLLKPGDQIWVGQELYGKSTKLFRDLGKWNIDCKEFDPTDSEHIQLLEKSHANLVFVETMTNPRLRVVDLSRLADASHRAGARLMVDNTFATHQLCRPLEFGADLVVESLSKQVCGHSDSMVGLVASQDTDLLEEVRSVVSTFGMASNPLDCYLTHRGLLSLELRVQRACDNALALAKQLSGLKDIRVDYPGLPDHPQHALASAQFGSQFGWMLTAHFTLDLHGVTELMERLRPEIPFVPSLGDVVTTVSHPACTSHRGLSAEHRGLLGISDGTVRISCGIEPTQPLLAKFSAAVS